MLTTGMEGGNIEMIKRYFIELRKNRVQRNQQC